MYALSNSPEFAFWGVWPSPPGRKECRALEENAKQEINE